MRLTITILALSALSAFAEPDYNQLAEAIYKAEGGSKAKKPYGILSVQVNDEAHARRICLNTCRNNWRRWEKAGKPGSYIEWLANRYCPPAADPKGNRNWKANVAKLYKAGGLQ